jgi:hypothetical protein
MEQPYSPAAPTAVKKEKVVFPDGRFVWVHGLNTATFVSIQARAARQPRDPRLGGQDNSMLTLMQIAASCYKSDEPGAERIFSDLDLDKVGLLTMQEMVLIMMAVQRVNGTDATEQEVLKDFLAPMPEPNFSPSTTSASAISDGCLTR